MRTRFDSAVRRHGPAVLRVCRAVLGPGADAEDAWSETFLAALRAWPDLAPDTNLEAWLVRVAGRKAIDIVRRRARHAVPTDDLPEPAAPPSPVDDAEGLWAAVAELPERQRLAIAYHYLVGLPHTETAEVIGGTPEAVRRAASDGLRTLRRWRAVEQESGRGWLTACDGPGASTEPGDPAQPTTRSEGEPT